MVKILQKFANLLEIVLMASKLYVLNHPPTLINLVEFLTVCIQKMSNKLIFLNNLLHKVKSNYG